MNTQLWQHVVIDEAFLQDLRTWLTAQMLEGGMCFLLAHADDGVIWGTLKDNSGLTLSSDVFDNSLEYPALAVKLEPATLQQIRIFGTSDELFIWKDGNQFYARKIFDEENAGSETLEEHHVLWGDRLREVKDSFSIVVEGQRGLTHAIPWPNPPTGGRPAIKVRHYIEYDDHDQAYIALSRLVDLDWR